MKPIYLLALGLSVPAGLLIVWLSSDFSTLIKLSLGMLPAILVVLAAAVDSKKS